MMEKLLNLPPVASQHGRDVNLFVELVHWLMLALLVLWSVYFVYSLWRFRATRNPKADYIGVRSHASTWLEVGVASFEAVLLIGFAIPLWGKVVDDFPLRHEFHRDPGGGGTIRLELHLSGARREIRSAGPDLGHPRESLRLRPDRRGHEGQLHRAQRDARAARQARDPQHLVQGRDSQLQGRAACASLRMRFRG
jgi:hypothetical protein